MSIVTAALTLASLAVGIATPPPARAATAVKAKDLPPLSSPAPRKANPEVPAGDFSNAPPTASETTRAPLESMAALAASNTPPYPAVGVSPVDGHVTPMPTLVVSATPDTDTTNPVQYWFRIATGADGESGGMVNSGWQSATSFTPPPGSLAPGLYYWHVWTMDNDGAATAPNWVYKFRLQTHLGVAASEPYDNLGPATVNLTNGNLVVSSGSPTMATVGGNVGTTFTYNSLAFGKTGLTGTYTNDKNFNRIVDPATEGADTVRMDPTISFDWGLEAPVQHGSPLPRPLSTDSFLVRWDGFLTVPVTGDYWVGAMSDDGARIWVNDLTTPWLNNWTNQLAGNPVYPAASRRLTGGVSYPIRVDYYDATGPAVIKLYVKGANPSLPDMLVPTSWLSPKTTALPSGWESAADLDGDLRYTSARFDANQITLLEPDGTEHPYLLTNGVYATPADENGWLTKDAATGQYTLHDDDGKLYGFDKSTGALAWAQSEPDDRNPAAPIYTWSAGRLQHIKDPVSGRFVAHLQYGGNPMPSPAPTCPAPPSGFDQPPGGMLCAIQYWAKNPENTTTNATTHVRYRNGQLARIEDPGSEVTDFGYDVGGRLVQVRDPLASDAVAAVASGVTIPGVTDSTSVTQITYDANSRVASLTGPVPEPGKPAPQHSYRYATSPPTSPPTGPTYVDVAGLAQPLGFARRVDFNNDGALPFNGQLSADTDATGAVTRATWDEGDRPISRTDSANRTTVTAWDQARRPTDVYGPAPDSCFRTDSARLPNGSCTQVPTTTTRYDEGIVGLASTYWKNTTMSGSPYLHDTGVGDASGRLYRDWATAGPTGLGVTDSWSARFTGEILMPDASVYSFSAYSDEGVRVWIDDRLMVDDWSPHAARWDTTPAPRPTFLTQTPNERHRIRVEYYDNLGAARLELHWSRLGVPSAPVPGANLFPRYGLATSSITQDTTIAQGVWAAPTRSSATAYINPAYGLPNYEINDPTTINPTGANLSTQTTYETFGAVGSYMRRTAKIMPSGAQTTYSYWKASDATPTGACAGTVTKDTGLLRKVTDPARTEEFLYDDAGRMLGSRIGTEAFTCLAYDNRGRPKTKSVPAGASPASEPSRSVTFNYAVGGNPLTTSVSDPAGTVTTRMDLLGRVISYTDVWGNVTTTTYDQAGRLTDTSGPAGAHHTDYDAAGRPTLERLDGVTVATPTYDAAKELTSVDYGNGTKLAAVGRDTSGRTTALTWTKPATATTIATDAVVRSQSGRVIDETIDGVDANATAPNFGYDRVGRLTSATVPGHNLIYNYATTNTCGTTGAGKNTNRTSMTDNGGAATTYCYDAADRLTSTSDTAVGTIAHDAHGNVRQMGTQTLTYDGADRHTTTTSGATTVRYKRDATDRIVSRTVGVVTTRYGFSGPGDTADVTQDATGLVTERTIGLVGGVSLTKRSVGGDVWSHPNIHGDVMAATNASGTKVGATISYDPYGQNLTSPTSAAPDNSAGNYDYGWLGQHQRGTEHEFGSLPVIEMGARPYVPRLGRFLGVDPIEGGCANDYVYVFGDPSNATDLGGTGVCENKVIKKLIGFFSLLGWMRAPGQAAQFQGGEFAAKKLLKELDREVAKRKWTTIGKFVSTFRTWSSRSLVVATSVATVVDLACEADSSWLHRRYYDRSYPRGTYPSGGQTPYTNTAGFA